MPPRRRATLPATPDDIASLTLPQINERLERNERVLNTSLFSPAPNLASSPTSDPMRERLLAIRAALLERKAELEQAANHLDVSQLQAESSAQAQRRNSASNGLPNGHGAKSARARAMEIIEAGDRHLSPSSLQLPLSETLALGRRDFDDATARDLAALSIKPKPRPRRDRPRPDRQMYDPSDEIARAQAAARMQAFMSFKGDPEEDQWDYDLAGEGEYDGDGDRFALEAQGREPHRYEHGTREEVDEFGEDDEDWAEGNDDYLDRVR